MTDEEIAQKARDKTEVEKQREANDRVRRNQLAIQNFKSEEAAKRPAPTLVFDGEEDWRDIEWLVDTIVPAEGAGMLFGETDVGKTFNALNLGIHISAGLAWQGHTVTKGAVLFIEAEGGRSFALRKHAAKVAAGLSSKPLFSQPFVTIYESLGFGPDTMLEQAQARAATIREQATRRGGPPIRFVVVDTLAQNMHGDVDSNADMGAFLRVFRAFLKALSDEPVFGLLIHHPGHNNKDRARGAYALPADLDLIMGLEGTPDALTLSCVRMREGERFAPILLALEKCLVATSDGHSATTLVVVSRRGNPVSQSSSLSTQIVEYLKRHPAKTTEDIRKDLGVRKSRVVKAVDAMMDAKPAMLQMTEVQVGPNKSQKYSVASSRDNAGVYPVAL